MQRKYTHKLVITTDDGNKTEHEIVVRDGATIRALAPVGTINDLANIIGMENGDVVFVRETGELYLYGVIDTSDTGDTFEWCNVGSLVPNMQDLTDRIAALEAKVALLTKTADTAK